MTRVGSEGGLVPLDLHHNVMNVDELVADLHAAEGALGHDFLEAVVILDQLRQGSLQQASV